MATAQSSSAQTVTRAMHVLRCFRDADDLGVSQVARLVELPVSTTHRLLRALVDADLLEQDETSARYRLGGTLAEYGLIAYRQQRIHLVEPLLEQLAQATGCTSSIAVRHGSDAVMVGFSRWREASGHELQGIRLPLHASGLGRALLAWSPTTDPQLGRLPLEPLRPSTPTTIEELRAELERTRARGYALSDEVDPHFRVIGTPVLDAEGCARFAIGLRGQVEVMTDARIPVFAGLARDIARQAATILLGERPTQ